MLSKITWVFHTTKVISQPFSIKYLHPHIRVFSAGHQSTFGILKTTSSSSEFLNRCVILQDKFNFAILQKHQGLLFTLLPSYIIHQGQHYESAWVWLTYLLLSLVPLSGVIGLPCLWSLQLFQRDTRGAVMSNKNTSFRTESRICLNDDTRSVLLCYCIVLLM